MCLRRVDWVERVSCLNTSKSSSLDKSFLTSFSWRDSPTPNWKLLFWKSPVCLRNSSPMTPPHVLGIPVDVTPPCPCNSSWHNPPPLRNSEMPPVVFTSESSSLDKSFLTSFSWRDLPTPNWKLLFWKPPCAFGIPVQWIPPCPWNSSRCNLPSPSEFQST